MNTLALNHEYSCIQLWIQLCSWANCSAYLQAATSVLIITTDPFTDVWMHFNDILFFLKQAIQGRVILEWARFRKGYVSIILAYLMSFYHRRHHHRHQCVNKIMCSFNGNRGCWAETSGDANGWEEIGDGWLIIRWGRGVSKPIPKQVVKTICNTPSTHPQKTWSPPPPIQTP